jgi:hypothetical protein
MFSCDEIRAGGLVYNRRTMTFVDILHEYFRGEKQIGVTLAVVGAGLLAGAFWVSRTQSGGFAWGLGVPFVVLGLAFGGGGTFLALRTDKQVADLGAQLQTNPEAVYAAELPRMAKVNANWPRLKIAWAVLIGVALVLLLAVHREWAHGLGLALLLMTTILFFTDVFAERRALIYTEALERARAGGARSIDGS